MPDQHWLDLVREPIIDPDLPICDPHNHLWDHPGSRYLVEELLADMEPGHNFVSSVFVECVSGYRQIGPEFMKPVGETEFVDALAASATGGSTKVAAGIVGFADLTLGAELEPVLDAHIEASPGRFRGIRHATAWHPQEDIRNAHTNPPADLMQQPSFHAGLALLAKRGW